MKPVLIPIFCAILTISFSCKTEEILLHGEITGFVTDTTNSQPIQAVPVKLNPLNDTTSTSSDGKYLFKSLIPGDYKIEVSKPPYAKNIRKAAVTSANTTEIDFALRKISYPQFSERRLDFGFDSIQKSFTISNTGIGKLNFSITATQDWISVNPNIGEITTEPQIITVTVNRTGLSVRKHTESIEIVSHVGQDLIRDTVEVLMNGFMDQRDFQYYEVVTIGTQTWLSENLNIGTKIGLPQEQLNNGVIEKWCYDCKTYGGLYNYFEAAQYSPNDTASIGTTQGICPVGWHIPTPKEFDILINYAGGIKVAGGKLKEAGNAHWQEPNSDATDDYGFTALPGGNTDRCKDFSCDDPMNNKFGMQGLRAMFWSTVWTAADYTLWDIEHSTYFWLPITGNVGIIEDTPWCGKSVRCIKDPTKK